jgi:preprotein translocase subunit SecY
MEQAQRRIPVQYAKRMVGRRMYGGTSTYIPLKVNQGGVIPVLLDAAFEKVMTKYQKRDAQRWTKPVT